MLSYSYCRPADNPFKLPCIRLNASRTYIHRSLARALLRWPLRRSSVWGSSKVVQTAAREVVSLLEVGIVDSKERAYRYSAGLAAEPPGGRIDIRAVLRFNFPVPLRLRDSSLGKI